MRPPPDTTAPDRAARPVAAAPELEVLPGEVSGVFDFGALFGRSAPVEIEIGIGKGRFLLQAAAARPETDFLGVEWSLKHLRVAKERAARRGLANVRFHRADARHVVADLVPDAALARVHVYCPDPWPKKRHHKRRFFTPATAPHLERILAPGGTLNLSTDFAEYFEAILALLRAHTRLEEAVDPLYAEAAPGGRTNYEVKYVAAGRVIHRAAFRRRVGR